MVPCLVSRLFGGRNRLVLAREQGFVDRYLSGCWWSSLAHGKSQTKTNPRDLGLGKGELPLVNNLGTSMV